jgi:hypothetical protein
MPRLNYPLEAEIQISVVKKLQKLKMLLSPSAILLQRMSDFSELKNCKRGFSQRGLLATLLFVEVEK